MCIIDTEGNTDQCVGVEAIPDFVRVVTKDARVVLEVVDDIASGKLKMKNGNPVQTLAIDSASVLWAVQQEVASANAEARAARYNRPVETANSTQLDWALAKRPLKRLNTKINASPIKYLIFTAREKDEYEDQPDGTQKKIGVMPELMKGTDFEMNFALRFDYHPNGQWFAEVTKVQGKLGEMYPMGTKLSEFPIKELIKYASKLAPSAQAEKNDDDLAREIAKSEVATAGKTEASLMAFANQIGFKPDVVAKILQENGITKFEVEKYDEMKKLLQVAATG